MLYAFYGWIPLHQSGQRKVHPTKIVLYIKYSLFRCFCTISTKLFVNSCKFIVVTGGSVGSPVLFVVLNITWFSCCRITAGAVFRFNFGIGLEHQSQKSLLRVRRNMNRFHPMNKRNKQESMNCSTFCPKNNNRISTKRHVLFVPGYRHRSTF